VIAVALVHHSHLPLLDEPTLGLDVETTEDVKPLLREIASKKSRPFSRMHSYNWYIRTRK
jgi:ABC-type multidrug transport system ATPase subunit